MPLTIVIESNGNIPAARKYFDTLMTRLQKPDPKRAVKRVAEMWAHNFKGEGSMVGGWAQLAQSTIEERERQGFGGTHPILIRYGSLYAMSTLWFMDARPGIATSWSMNRGRPVATTASLDITDGTATLGLAGPKTVHQKGNWTPPKRQYWFTDRNIVLAARLGVLEWINDEVLPRGAGY